MAVTPGVCPFLSSSFSSYREPSARMRTVFRAHRGSSAYTISIAKTFVRKQSVGARDVRYPATCARKALNYKEIASWAAGDAFPEWQEGRHPHCHFRGLFRPYSRYGPPDRSAAHRRPLSRGSSPRSYLREPLVSYRINRQLSGWIPPPLTIRAFGAHCQFRDSCATAKNTSSENRIERRL
jgi:hypothetical protein